MKWRKFGFFRHNKRIKLEGVRLTDVINKCIKNGIHLKNLHWKDPIESTVEIRGDDFHRLKRLAGHSYRMTVLNEGGAVPLLKTMKANILTITGAFLLGALIFYQSLFIAEIRIDGYGALSETRIRETLRQAGLYEGARLQDDYSDVKAALYEEHGEITWVSIYQDGRLVKVHVAQADRMEAEKETKAVPVNIVASRSAMIEKIIPLEGNAKVQKGDYVNEGDVLISGRYKYQSTDYSRGDDFFTMYSHARGQVMARTPKQLNFYMEKTRRIKKPTGKRIPGFFIKFGDVTLDTTGELWRYEASVRDETILLDLVKPLPVSIGLVVIREVELTEEAPSMKKTEAVAEAAIRQYQREEMKVGEEILSKKITYSETDSLMKVGVFMEVLEDIGVEKPIKLKKKKTL